MEKITKENTLSDRILVTPSSYARNHYLYVQEVGTLKSLQPHISRREKLESYLFFLVLDGEGTVTYQGQIYHLTAGDCVWLDCRFPYSHESSPKHLWSLMWVHFHGKTAPDFYETYTDREGPVIYKPVSVTPYIQTLQALYNFQAGKDAMSDLLCHKHLTDLITMIFSDNFQAAGTHAIPQKFLDIQTYLKEHYADRLTLDDLSALFFISKYHMARQYQALFGTTILNDLTLNRLAHAKSLLRFSSESVEQIALSCGFQTSAYFIKVFRKYENMTPLEYRLKW